MKITKKLFFYLVGAVLVLLAIDLLAHGLFFGIYGKLAWQMKIKTPSRLEVHHPHIPYLRQAWSDDKDPTYKWFRGREPDSFRKADNEVRILVMGGSSAVSRQEFNRSWAGVLEQELARSYPDKRIAVLNQAHGAYVTVDNLVLYSLLSQDFQFDLLVVYEGWNDAYAQTTQGFQPDYSHARGRPGGHLKTAHFIHHLVETHPWLKYSGLLAFVAQQLFDFSIKTVNSRMWQGSNSPPRHATGVSTYERNLRSLAAIAVARKAQVVLVSQVFRFRGPLSWSNMDKAGWVKAQVTMEDNLAMARVARDNPGVHFFDAASIFPQDGRYFTDNLHFSLEGDRLMGDLIAEFLKDQGLVKRWSPAYDGPGIVFAFNGLDKAKLIGKAIKALALTPGTLDTEKDKRPFIKSRLDQAPSGVNIPLGFLGKGEYNLTMGLGYGEKGDKITPVHFGADLIQNNRSHVIVDLDLGRDYSPGEVVEQNRNVTLPKDGEAWLKLTARLAGKDSPVMCFWGWPVLRRTDLRYNASKSPKMRAYLTNLQTRFLKNSQTILLPGGRYELVRDVAYQVKGEKGAAKTILVVRNKQSKPSLCITPKADITWKLQLPKAKTALLSFLLQAPPKPKSAGASKLVLSATEVLSGQRRILLEHVFKPGQSTNKPRQKEFKVDLSRSLGSSFQLEFSFTLMDASDPAEVVLVDPSVAIDNPR